MPLETQNDHRLQSKHFYINLVFRTIGSLLSVHRCLPSVLRISGQRDGWPMLCGGHTLNIMYHQKQSQSYY